MQRLRSYRSHGFEASNSRPRTCEHCVANLEDNFTGPRSLASCVCSSPEAGSGVNEGHGIQYHGSPYKPVSPRALDGLNPPASFHFAVSNGR